MKLVDPTPSRRVPEMKPAELCAELAAPVDPEAVIFGDLAEDARRAFEAQCFYALELARLIELIRTKGRPN